MSDTTVNAVLDAPDTPLGALVRKVAGSYRGFTKRRKARRASCELRRLSGHTLKDIGLHHSEITSVVCADQTGRRRRYAGS